MTRIRSFLREARRRRVYTSAAAYVVVAGGTIQLASSIFTSLELPDTGLKVLIVLLILAFPIVLVLAWMFDVDRAGIHKTTAILGGETKEKPAPGGGWTAPPGRLRQDPPKRVEVVKEAPAPERVRNASLAFVRHELRTPINAIIGYSEMLLDDATEERDTQAAGDLGRVVRCGREILGQVERILDPERISADTHRDVVSYGEQIRANLRDPLSAVMGYTEMLIEDSHASGRTARVADLDRVLAASRRLLELSNDIVAVATNAADAAPADMARGASLAEDVLSKVRSVQEHRVEADRRGSLLVVDDSPMNRDLLAKQLARKGYLVTTAESGAAAFELMAERSFDLVLLDVLMPELDGVGVLIRMKTDPALCSIPVIMISALDEVDSVVRCLEIGAADFVSKPFHPTLLDARINSALQARTPGAADQTSHTVDDESPVGRMIAGTLPAYVVDRLRAGETRALDAVSDAAVFFVDMDQAVAATDPARRAALTENLIDAAHRAAAEEGAIVLLHGIGLAMAAGFPKPDPEAAHRLARTALRFSREAEQAGIKLRSGLHTGSVIGAVVGRDVLSFWIWGEGVDIARRLAISAERGRINMSAACSALLKDDFTVTSRGVIELAGHGQMRAYVLESEAVAATS